MAAVDGVSAVGGVLAVDGGRLLAELAVAGVPAAAGGVLEDTGGAVRDAQPTMRRAASTEAIANGGALPTLALSRESGALATASLWR